MKTRRQIRVFITTVVLVVSTVLFMSSQAIATDYGAGFFSGLPTASGASGGFVLRNCKTSGEAAFQKVVDASNKKEALIELMWEYYSGCGLNEQSSTGESHGTEEFNIRRNRVGARYIIWTMTGENPNRQSFKDSKGVFSTSLIASSSAPFDYWKTLFRQSNVAVVYNGNHSTTKNSGYVKTNNGQYDVYQFSQDETSKRAIEIYQSGTLKYVIRVECGNPLGGKMDKIIPPKEEPKENIDPPPKKEEDKESSWSLSPISLVKKCARDFDAFCWLGTYQTNNLTVISGDQVKWAHRVYNTGPDKTNTNINIVTKKQTNTSGVAGSWSDIASDVRLFGGWLNRPGVPTGSYIPSFFYPTRFSLLLPSIQTINSGGSDIGKTFCQKVLANPRSSKNTGSVSSDKVCVTVRHSWFLKASTTINKTIVNKEDAGGVKWTHTVTNNGPSKVLKDKDNKEITVSAFIKRSIYKKDTEYPTTESISSTVLSGIKNQEKNISKSVDSTLVSVDDDVVRVCEWLVIKPESSESKGDLESAEKCVDIESTTKLDWEINPITTVDKTKAFIGDKVTWTHKVENKGPNETTEEVKYWYKASDKKILPKETVINGLGSFKSLFNSDDGKIPNNVNPGNFCRNTTAQPKSSIDNGEVVSSDACVNVPYNYKLTPSTSLDSTNPTPGSVVGVRPKVKNRSPNEKSATKSEKVNWKLKAYVNDNIPVILKEGQDKFLPDDTSMDNIEYALDDFSFGDKVCFSLWLSKEYYNGINNTSGGGVESEKECVAIGKRPKVQVLGGDIWAKGEISTNMNKLATNKFIGSWAEYGAIAEGKITGLATGGALGSQETVCGYSLLSFTNKQCGESIPVLGNYNFIPSNLNISNFFNLSPNTVIDVDLSGDGNIEYSFNNDVNIQGGGDITGTKVIYAQNNKVTISNDIKYANNLYNINAIPQVLIIADNIEIKSNVKQVDAWLVANNVINTCSGVDITGGVLIGDACPEKLIINGPVKAKKIKFHRTYGSNDTDSQGDPAETINFRPDAYLWAFNRMNQGFSIKSTYIIDQPVRF